MAKLSGNQIDYIKKNYNGSNVQELSRKLNCPSEDVERMVERLKESNKVKVKKLFPVELDFIYRFTRTDYFIFISLFLISLVNYVYTMTPGIAAGDCGELTCAVYFLGGAHSPGYPLYCIVGKLFMGLFFFIGRIVYRLTFFSAFGGAMTVSVSYLVFIKFLGRYHHQNRLDNLFFAKVPAVAAALFFLFADDLWSQAVIAEVYTLNSLFLPVMFLLALLYEERYSQNTHLLLDQKSGKQYFWNRSIKLMYMFYFLFGVAMGDHHIILGYFIPFTLYFIYTHFRDKTFFRLMILITIAYLLGLVMVVYYQLPETFDMMAIVTILVIILYLIVKLYSEHPKFLTAIMIGAGFMLLGVLVYAYMPIRSLANAPLDWGNPEILENFVNVVTRKQYRGFAQNIRTIGTMLQQFIILFKWRLEQFTPFLYIFTFLGLYRLFKLNRKWFYFTVSFLLYYDFAFSQFNNFKFTARDMFFAEVFFIPSYMVNIIWIAVGLEYAVVLLEKHVFKKPLAENKMIGFGVSAFLIALSVIPFKINFKKNNVRHAWVNDSYGRNILKTLDYKAINFTEGGDNQVFSLLYHTYVEHLRPDVEVYDQKGNVFLLYGDMMRMSPQQLQESQITKDYEKISTGRPVYYTWKDYWRQNEINKRYNENFDYMQTGILYKVVRRTLPYAPLINYWLYYDFEWMQYPEEAREWDYLSREIVANYNFQLGDYYMEKAYNSYNLSKQVYMEPERSRSYYREYEGYDKKAYDNYRKAQYFGYDMTAIHFNLGLLLEQKIRILQQENKIDEINAVLDEAIKDYIIAAEIENRQDNAPRAYFTAGRGYEKKAFYNPEKEADYMKEALKYYRIALEISPDFQDAQMAARRADAVLKYPTRQLADMEKNLAKDPANEKLYFELVKAYIDRMEANRSVTLLEQASRIMPNNMNVLFNLANLYQQLRRPQEAISVFNRISRMNPNEPTIYYYLGENHYALKQYEQAYGFYKRFISMAYNINDNNIRSMVSGAQQKIRSLAPYYEH